MRREIPSYLRVVQNGEQPIPEAHREFDWKQEPHTLREVEIVVNELYKQSERIDSALPDDFEDALQRIECAMREDEIGLIIEEAPITKNSHSLIAIFETLLKIEQAVDAYLFPELPEQVAHTAEVILERIIEVAARGGRSELAVPNPAFRYILQIYEREPVYQQVIEDQLPQPAKKMVNAADWSTRAQEQAQLEKIGRQLHDAHTTLDLLRRLPMVITPSRRIYLNPSAQVRRPVNCAGLLGNIVTEVRNMGEDALERFGALRDNGYKPDDITTINLPQLGDYNVLTTVLPEIQREKVKWQRLCDQNKGEVTLRQCDSWFMLVWFINRAVSGTDEFRFSAVDPETGMETIKRLSGRQVIDCVEYAPSDQNLVHILPNHHSVRAIRPKDRFLIELRERLANLLD